MNNFPKTNEEFFDRLGSAAYARNHQQGEINTMIGLHPVSADLDTLTAVFSHEVKASELNILGILHGGIISWLLDTSMGALCGAYTASGNPTATYTGNFIRGMKEGEKLEITATIDHVGGHLISAHSIIKVGEQICATGCGTFFRLSK